MIPTNNGSSTPCDPISSNCVIWQGPDIPCINLCNGDTVSEVIAKLAQELCDIIDATCDCNPDLRELKLNCIPPPSQENPDLAQYLNAIIEYVCALPTGPDNIIVELPDCLHYDNSQGNPVTALPIDEYALYLANTICDILDAIAIINNQISQLIERIVILENCVLPCNPSSGGGDPLVISSCIIRGGQPGPASILLLALESAFCAHVVLVGENPAIQSAINSQCIQGSFPMLSPAIATNPNAPNPNSKTVTTYSASANWVPNASTLAAGHQNQWVVICDLYNAVLDIQQNCCDGGCDSVSISQTSSVQTNDATGLPTSITFNFTGSSVPSGFNDCGSNIVITDMVGNQISQAFDVVLMQSSQVGVIIGLQQSGLDLTSNLNVSISTCVSDTGNQCTDSISFSVPLTLPCPAQTAVKANNQAGTSVALTWTNQLGTSVTYGWTCFDSSGQVFASGTVTTPGGSPAVPITNLTPGETYSFEITITNSSGNTVTCPAGTYSVPGIVCTNALYTAVSKQPAPNVGVDIFLGHKNFGDGKRQYWFDTVNKELQLIPVAGNNYCKNPELAWDTTVSPTGGFDITIDSRNAVFGQITIEYSLDMINWTPVGTYTQAQTLSIATGATNGSIYVRGFEDCGGGTPSVPTILRYDFNTNQQTVFTDDENCPELLGSTAQPIACPGGPTVAKGTIGCEGTNYDVPGSASLTRSIWAYVGKTVDVGVTYYVYAAFTETGDCSGVLYCCECPAFIMPWKLGKQTNVAIGGTTTLTIPYLIGDGTAEISLIGTPMCGTTTQSNVCLLYTSPSPRDGLLSRMPSSA